MKCGLLLEGPRTSTIQAARLALKACKTEQKATAALEQALALLTSRAEGTAPFSKLTEETAEEEAAEEKAAAAPEEDKAEEPVQEE